MRNKLKEVIEKSLTFKYDLPNNQLKIDKSKVSTTQDECYSSSCNTSLANIIYNSVVEYAFDQYRINESDFDTLHRLALSRKMKFNDEAPDLQKLKYGFYGEVLLYCFLYVFYKTPPAISRGHLFQVLEKGETKGYC